MNYLEAVIKIDQLVDQLMWVIVFLYEHMSVLINLYFLRYCVVIPELLNTGVFMRAYII